MRNVSRSYSLFLVGRRQEPLWGRLQACIKETDLPEIVASMLHVAGQGQHFWFGAAIFGWCARKSSEFLCCDQSYGELLQAATWLQSRFYVFFSVKCCEMLWNKAEWCLNCFWFNLVSKPQLVTVVTNWRHVLPHFCLIIFGYLRSLMHSGVSWSGNNRRYRFRSDAWNSKDSKSIKSLYESSIYFA